MKTVTSQDKIPPGPKHRFLGANASLKFYTNIAGYLKDKQKQYGDFVLLKATNHPIYLINNLEYVEQILVKESKNFTKGTGYQRSRVILGNGIFTSDGEFHDSQRKLINPAFHKSRIEEYYKTVAFCTNDFLTKWGNMVAENPNIDVQTEITRLFIAIIFNSMFSSDSSEELIDLGAYYTELFNSANPFLLLDPQRAIKLPLPSVKKFMKTKNELDFKLRELIKKRKKEDTFADLDILNMLMHAESNEGKRMSDDELFDEVRTLFVAANDTSAKVLTWALYNLSQNPDAKAKCLSEINTVLDGKFPEYHDYQELKYIRMCINETMRLYPPLWMITRTPINDFFLDDYLIKKDSSIFMVPLFFQKDERYYANPESFIPERWTDEERKKRPRLSFVPFGAGPRYCIGESFAMFHLVIILSAILQKFDFKLHPKQKVEISSSMLLKPKYGMTMILEEK